MTLRTIVLVLLAATLLSVKGVMAYQQPSEQKPEQVRHQTSIGTCAYWWKIPEQKGTGADGRNTIPYWWTNSANGQDPKKAGLNHSQNREVIASPKTIPYWWINTPKHIHKQRPYWWALDMKPRDTN